MIIQVAGINGLGKTKGCELSPSAICDSLSLKSRTLDLDNEDLENQELIIYNEASKILDLMKEKNEKIVFIGGDHSISYPIGKSFLEKTKNPAIIVFDAHYDLMEPMQNPTHEEWLRALIENKNFKNVLLVGIRRNSENIDEREIDFARKNSIKIIYADEFEKRKSEILDFCKDKETYLSFDMDVFDKSIFDAVGYPEKNGLNEKQVIGLLEEIKGEVAVADVVEYNPNLDGNGEGLHLVGKILKALEK